MPGTLEQVGSGDVAIENRDRRFAELDAQINAASQVVPNNQITAKPRKRRCPSTRLPAAVRKKIAALPES